MTYADICRIDAQFQSALVAVYGKRAREMRYRASELTPQLRTMAAQYQTAAEEWRKRIYEYRSDMI
jgi:hypothetical protein